MRKMLINKSKKMVSGVMAVMLAALLAVTFGGCSNTESSLAAERSSNAKSSNLAQATTENYEQKYRDILDEFSIKTLSYNVTDTDGAFIDKVTAQNDTTGKATVATYELKWKNENSDYVVTGIDFIDGNGEKLTYTRTLSSYEVREDYKEYLVVRYVGEPDMSDITVRIKCEYNGMYRDIKTDETPVGFDECYDNKNVVNIKGRPYLLFSNVVESGASSLVDVTVLNSQALMPLDSVLTKTLTDEDCNVKFKDGMSKDKYDNVDVDVYVNTEKCFGERSLGRIDCATRIMVVSSYSFSEADVDNETVQQKLNDERNSLVDALVTEFDGDNGKVEITYKK